ncbi:LAFE_0E11474g1_1 [Lachancea fermentati]|uniref:LAFE_0E11474g1_1 n=1 Tax=Lachancea fermentati TaxID=4955 RepID=A0A1G4ME15_LACFM|nr:LAFE_0E11474g1_1 [Lachancea fermentati]
MFVPFATICFFTVTMICPAIHAVVTNNRPAFNCTSWAQLTSNESADYERINLMRCIEFNYNKLLNSTVAVVAYREQDGLCISVPDDNYNSTGAWAKAIALSCWKVHYVGSFSLIGPLSEYDIGLTRIGTIVEIGHGTLNLTSTNTTSRSTPTHRSFFTIQPTTLQFMPHHSKLI